MKKVELMGAERRRRFNDVEKKAIIAESFDHGATVAGVARRYEVSPSLIYAWRKSYRDEIAGEPCLQGDATDAPSGFARAILQALCAASLDPIRVHVYEQIVVEIPAGADVAVVSALIRSLRV